MEGDVGGVRVRGAGIRGAGVRRAEGLPLRRLPGYLAGEVAYEVVRGVAAVRRLVEEGDVDEAVEGGLGAAFAGAQEPGEERDPVRRQVERADPAQGEGGVPVGLAVRGPQRVEGHRERAAHAEVVVFEVVQPAVAGGQLTGERVRCEDLAGGEPGRDDPQCEWQPSGEADERVRTVEAVPSGDGPQQFGALLVGEGCEREAGHAVQGGEGRAAGDDHRAAGAGRQQGADLGGVHGVVQYEQGAGRRKE